MSALDHNPASTPNAVDSANSTTTLLTAGNTFTGDWVQVTNYDSVVIAVKTDQEGTLTLELSPDGVNADSTLVRYYRTTQIEAPHRFTLTRDFMRVTFENTSDSDQTYLRLQTTMGNKAPLNAPIDSTLAQDFDALPTRPTNYHVEVALGLRQGHTQWNKWGYNTDVDTAAPELIASFGGSFSPMTTARTLSIVSTSTDDDNGGTGCNNVVVYGIDENREAQTVVVTMDGTTPVVTTESWLGVNRIAVGSCGSGQVNAGTITATATTDLTTQGQIPAGVGSSQQCIFCVQTGHRALFNLLHIDVTRFGSGTEPVVTVKCWVYSPVSNAKYEVARILIDTSLQNNADLTPESPFPVVGPAVFWLEATTSRDDTEVAARFDVIEVRDAST